MLLEKLDEFELANKNLRRLLKEAQNRQVGILFDFQKLTEHFPSISIHCFAYEYESLLSVS